MKINGWQRIALVASGLWMIGATYIVRSEQIKELEDQLLRMNWVCRNGNFPITPMEKYSECVMKVAEKKNAVMIEQAGLSINDLERIIEFAVLPVLIAWIAVFVAYFVFA